MDGSTTLPPDVAAKNRGPGIIAAICSVLALSTVFVAARLYVTTRILKKTHIDDYLITISLLSGWATVAFSIAAVHAGNGRHIQTLTHEQVTATVLWTTIGFVPGVLSFGVPKLAVVALFSRILLPSRAHQIFLWTLTGTCLLVLLSCTGVVFAQSDLRNPEITFLDPRFVVRYCMFGGSFSAFVDLYLAVYPSIVLCKLRMEVKKKVALSIILGLSSLATIVAIYKTSRLPELASPDFSYHTSDLILWTCIEGSTITIASCLPILRPLLELALGHEALSDSRKRRRRASFGSDPSTKRKFDIEIGRSGATSEYDGGLGSLDRSVDISHEDIALHQEPSRVYLTPTPGIIRTDSIMISFEQNHHGSDNNHWCHGAILQG